MRIYVRHAEKEYNNGQSIIHPFDPPATERGIEKASALADKLYSSFGAPTLIVSSPFLRTRQTASAIRSRLFEKTGIAVPIVCDKRVGEYLGNHRISGDDGLFTHQTKDLDPLLEDNISHFNSRLREHNDIMGSLDKDHFSFWIVTHGLVIKKLSRFNGCFFPGYPAFLSGIIVEGGEKVTTLGSWKVPRRK